MFSQLAQDLDFIHSPQTCRLPTVVYAYGDFTEGLVFWHERRLLIVWRVTAKQYKIYSEIIRKSSINNNN